MSEIRIPLPNGTQLIFFQSEQMKTRGKQFLIETQATNIDALEKENLNSKAVLEDQLSPQKMDSKDVDQPQNVQNQSEPVEDPLTDNTNWPFMMASVNELQEISLALIYYKTYLQGKGQKDKAAQIGEIDHKVFQTLQQARQH